MPYRFASIKSDRQLRAGGKGGTLARLFQSGYPVPDGLIFLPEEFENDELKPEAWAQARTCLASLRKSRAENGLCGTLFGGGRGFGAGFVCRRI